MHPELIAALATEHRRELAARLTAAPPAGDPGTPARRRGAGRPRPRLRVSWSRATLAAAAGHQPGRSLVIVISATRAR